MTETGAVVTLSILIAVVFAVPQVTDDSREALFASDCLVPIHHPVNHHPFLAVLSCEALVAVTLCLVTDPVVVAVVFAG